MLYWVTGDRPRFECGSVLKTDCQDWSSLHSEVRV